MIGAIVSGSVEAFESFIDEDYFIMICTSDKTPSVKHLKWIYIWRKNSQKNQRNNELNLVFALILHPFEL